MLVDRPGAVGRALLLALLVAVGLATTTTTAHGGTTPPAVLDLSVSGAEAADGVLEVRGTVRATDTASGMDRVVVMALRTEGRRDADRVVGEVVVQPDFPGQATLDEAWTIRAADPDVATLALRVVAFDRDGRFVRLDAAELEALGLPSVVGVDGADVPPPGTPPAPPPPPGEPVADATPPTLTGLTAAATTRFVDGNDETVVWVEGRVAGADTGDGVERVVVGALDEHGHGMGSAVVLPTRVGASAIDEPFAFPLVRPADHNRLPDRALLRLTAYDVAGNVTQLDVAGLADRGWPAVLDLTDPTPPDPTPPDPTPEPPAPEPPAPDPDPSPQPPTPEPDPGVRVPFIAPPSGDGVARLSGPDRTATAERIARAGWPDGADEVVVSTGTSFPDALAAAPLAARRGAPVLLTTGDQAALVARVRALGADRVTLVGGPAAVSPAHVDGLADAGVTVRRSAGADRYATAAGLADAWASSDVVWVASGASSADALAAGAAAAQAGAPLLLTDPSNLPDATRVAIRRLRPSRVVLVGGTAAVRASVESELADLAVVQRVAGSDRWATAVEVARVGWADDPARPVRDGIGHDRALLADGTGFADAVAGAPLAAGGWGPVLLSTRDGLPPATSSALVGARAADGLVGVTLLGGRAALSDGVAAQVGVLLR